MKHLPLGLFIIAIIFSCDKNDITVPTESRPDTIIIENIHIPTITKGFYGQVLRWRGDFMPGSENPGTVTPVTNEIYIYEEIIINEVFDARVDSNDWNFYYLDSMNIDPLYVIFPNDSGYYEIDLDSGHYSTLIKIRNNQLFINLLWLLNGQLGPLNTNGDQLIRKNMDINFEMTI